MNKRTGLVVAGMAAVALMAGGTAYAASSSPMTDSAGNIYGCYDSGGNLKLLDPSVTTTCPKGYSPLDWNQAGQAGQNGTNGTSVVTSSSVPTGSCTPGDTDIELSSNGTPGNGDVFTCYMNGQIGQWGYTNDNIAGTNGTPATPLTWNIACPPGTPAPAPGFSGYLCAPGSTDSIPAGVVLTPVSITQTGGCAGGTAQIQVFDAPGDLLVGLNGVVSGPVTTTVAGPLGVHIVSNGCTTLPTFTFTFGEAQTFS